MKKIIKAIVPTTLALCMVFSGTLVFASNANISPDNASIQLASYAQDDVKSADLTEVTEDTKHTVTLQHTEPIKEGDEYAWLIISEPGQLGACINALGLGNPNPEMFGEDTSVIFAQDEINLEQISSKFNLNTNARNYSLTDNSIITINYSQDDMTYPQRDIIFSQDNTTSSQDNIVPFTTGSFSRTLSANASSNYFTSSQIKDDNEQRAYLTITSIAPTAYQNFGGLYARVGSSVTYAHTSWYNFRSTGAYSFSYNIISGRAGDSYWLEIANTNDRATDVAGRWTP